MICIPIKAPTMVEAFQLIEKAEKSAEIIEIWLDQIADLDIERLLYMKKKPIILVNKPVREQGKYTGSEESRIDLLKQGIIHGADYIDVGIDTSPHLIKDLVKHKQNSKIIISYHNFSLTPELKELVKIANSVIRLKADIFKIATFAKNIEDILIIYELALHLQKKGKAYIAFCIGETGKISRIMAPYFGSLITYLALDEEQRSAPGQFTVDEYTQIIKLLTHVS